MNKIFLLALLFSLSCTAEETLPQEIIEFTIMGTGNNVTIEQVHHSTYVNQTMVGNNNTSVILQSGSGTKEINSVISGNYNTQNITQSGSGHDELDITLIGNHNSATILQAGSVENEAIVHLENVGGPSTLTLTQTGGPPSDSNQYGITQLCANPAGCSVSVTQTAH